MKKIILSQQLWTTVRNTFLFPLLSGSIYNGQWFILKMRMASFFAWKTFSTITGPLNTTTRAWQMRNFLEPVGRLTKIFSFNDDFFNRKRLVSTKICDFETVDASRKSSSSAAIFYLFYFIYVLHINYLSKIVKEGMT